MEVENGKFYFIKDSYLKKFEKYNLMQNKENGNKRPCYFCFKDKKNENIIWFVPISSKVEKYKEIYKKKSKENKSVYNFVFGEVLNQERVFLIQNMFPTTKKYIKEKYKTRNQDVEISRKLSTQIIEISNKVIILAERGINIPFYNIIEMKKILLEDNCENNVKN